MLREQIAERIWRAEYRRATGKERSIDWAEVNDGEVLKYLYVADAILQLPGILGPAQGQRDCGVEIRKQNDAIDEIIVKGGTVHIEQMSNDGWFMGVDGLDGSYWQFWFGAKNRKSHVEFRHTEYHHPAVADFTKPASPMTSTQCPAPVEGAGLNPAPDRKDQGLVEEGSSTLPPGTTPSPANRPGEVQ